MLDLLPRRFVQIFDSQFHFLCHRAFAIHMQQCVQVFLQFLSSNHGPAAAFVLHAEFYSKHPA